MLHLLSDSVFSSFPVLFIQGQFAECTKSLPHLCSCVKMHTFFYRSQKNNSSFYQQLQFLPLSRHRAVAVHFPPLWPFSCCHLECGVWSQIIKSNLKQVYSCDISSVPEGRLSTAATAFTSPTEMVQAASPLQVVNLSAAYWRRRNVLQPPAPFPAEPGIAGVTTAACSCSLRSATCYLVLSKWRFRTQQSDVLRAAQHFGV